MESSRSRVSRPFSCRSGVLAGLITVLVAGASPTRAEGPKENILTRQEVNQVKAAIDQRKSIDASGSDQPLMRMVAALTNAALADNNAYEEEAAAAGVDTLVSLEGITPTSPVLDHCDRVTALTARADAIAQRYPEYIAIGRKQGEMEVAAKRMQPGEVDAFAEAMAEQSSGFQLGWTLAGKLAHEAGALCTVLARRHWQVDSSGTMEIAEPDLTEAQHLLESLQQVVPQIVTLEQTRRARAEKRISRLPVRR
jgi:hypothetical protein